MQAWCVRSMQRTVLHEQYNDPSLVLALVHEETEKRAGTDAVDPLQTRVSNLHDETSEQTKKAVELLQTRSTVADSCKLARAVVLYR